MGTNGTSGGKPHDRRSHVGAREEMDVRAVLPTVRVPTLVVQHAEDALIVPAMGKYVADHIPDAKYVELRAGICTTGRAVAGLLPGGR